MEMSEKYCLNCGKEINGDYRKKFCNRSCAATYNNKNRKLSENTKEKISSSLRKEYTKEEKETLAKKSEKYYPKSHLKDRLIKNGIKENKCECCGNTGVWMGQKLILQLHHKDGNHKNNAIENLQILCPNCHSQTDNYCNKNRKFIKVEKTYCRICGKEITKSAITGLCKECYDKTQIKKLNVSEEQLRREFEECKNYSFLAKKYNVAAKTIKKWLIKYEIM